MTNEAKPNGGWTSGFQGIFHFFAHKTSVAVGSPLAFMLAMLTIVV